eukprot:2351135-Prymnesium_polylepis.1
MADQQLSAAHDATVLLDDSPEMITWANKDHCGVHCKNGGIGAASASASASKPLLSHTAVPAPAHCTPPPPPSLTQTQTLNANSRPHPQPQPGTGHCHSLVKVLKGVDGSVTRIGKTLTSFDALEAGAFVVRPSVFEVLGALLTRSTYCTLADAMQVLAERMRPGLPSRASALHPALIRHSNVWLSPAAQAQCSSAAQNPLAHTGDCRRRPAALALDVGRAVVLRPDHRLPRLARRQPRLHCRPPRVARGRGGAAPLHSIQPHARPRRRARQSQPAVARCRFRALPSRARLCGGLVAGCVRSLAT